MIRYFFLRAENREPVGCVASKLDRENGKLFFNYSLANKHDRFNRGLARKVALNRLESSPFVVSVDITKISATNLHKDIMNFFIDNAGTRNKKLEDGKSFVKVPEIPYRIRKLAKSWLLQKKDSQ